MLSVKQAGYQLLFIESFCMTRSCIESDPTGPLANTGPRLQSSFTNMVFEWGYVHTFKDF